MVTETFDGFLLQFPSLLDRQDGIPQIYSERVARIKQTFYRKKGRECELVPVVVTIEERQVKWSEGEINEIIDRALASSRPITVRVDSSEERQRLRYVLRHYWKKRAEVEVGLRGITAKQLNRDGQFFLLVSRVPEVEIVEEVGDGI